MRSVSVVLILVVIVVAMANAYDMYNVKNKVFYDVRDAPALFEKFMRDYNRHYRNAEDKHVHYLAFVKNLVKINKMNQLSDDDPYGSATFDINKFADYTEEEWNQMLGLRPVHPNRG